MVKRKYKIKWQKSKYVSNHNRYIESNSLLKDTEYQTEWKKLLSAVYLEEILSMQSNTEKLRTMFWKKETPGKMLT